MKFFNREYRKNCLAKSAKIIEFLSVSAMSCGIEISGDCRKLLLMYLRSCEEVDPLAIESITILFNYTAILELAVSKCSG